MGSIATPSPPSASPTNTTSITAALEAATQHYTTSNPTSHTTHLAASTHLPGGNTRTVLYTAPFPLTFHSGSSATLTTADGHGLTDFLSEYTAAIYGHSHPTIHAALTSALAGGWNYGGHSGAEGTLAALIAARFRPAVEMLRFVNSGTEANMLALATACAYTGGGGRKNILLFNKGYHGSTISGRLAPAATTTTTTTTAGKGTGTGKPSLNLPHAFHVATYNDLTGARRVVEALPPDSLAAILVEPMLGSGGCFRGTPAFLKGLRALADEYGALLVFDEVMTSRLGDDGGVSGGGGGLGRATAPDVVPDLMTLGKWVGGGMSFGAFGGRREIMKWFDPREGRLEHPGTFNNNVFTMAAGVAGMGLLTPEVLGALNERGERLRAGLDGVLSGFGLGTGFVRPGVEGPGEGEVDETGVLPLAPLTDAEQEDPAVYERWPPMFVKGVGSLLCVHFSGPRRAELHQLFWLSMVEKGFWIAARGFIALNIELTDRDVERFVEAVEGFVGTYKGVLKW